MARIGVHDVSVWTFSPYPGSELFERLRAAGRLPRLDDDYYASLLSYSDISGAVSYADALDSKQLQRWRLAGILLFYATSYLTHPGRPLRSGSSSGRRQWSGMGSADRSGVGEPGRISRRYASMCRSVGRCRG